MTPHLAALDQVVVPKRSSRPQRHCGSLASRVFLIKPDCGPHLFHVHICSGFAPASIETEDATMAFLKTRDTAEHDRPAETEVEGEIREFVRRDAATSLRRQPESEREMVASNINSLLQRAAGTSVQEIDKLITELETLRDTLRSEA